MGAITSRIPIQWFVPYILIAIASIVVTTLWVKTPDTLGYYWLSFLNGVTYVALIILILTLQKRESKHTLLAS